jgi:hypothetical protein
MRPIQADRPSGKEARGGAPHLPEARLPLRSTLRRKEKNLMTSRTTRKTVTFRHPFVLSGVDGSQPPGAYVVDTDEEPIDSVSMLAYRRIGTFIQIHRNGDSQVFPIDPVELDAALMGDAGQTVVSPLKGR